MDTPSQLECWDEGGSSEFREECENCPTARQNTTSTPTDQTRAWCEDSHRSRDVKCVYACATACVCLCPGGQEVMLWYLLCSQHWETPRSFWHVQRIISLSSHLSVQLQGLKVGLESGLGGSQSCWRPAAGWERQTGEQKCVCVGGGNLSMES